MAIQTAEGWILDVSHDYATGNINLLIKLQDGRIISFKQKLKEYVFYILPKSHSAGEDLFQQLSRNDQVIKKIFWHEKYIDLADRNKTRLIGISLGNSQSQDYQRLIKKLEMDSRVGSLYNIELSVIHQFIYNQLKIPPTSKVRIEYEQEELLSISRIDDRQETAPPPFKIMHIGLSSHGKNDEIILNLRLENQTSIISNTVSDQSFISVFNENQPDIAIIYGDYRQDHSTLTSVDNIITQYSNQTVIIHVSDRIEDIPSY